MKGEVLKMFLSLIMVVGLLGVNNAQQTDVSNKASDQQVSEKLSEYIEYPEDAVYEEVEGLVYVRFVTDENRKVSNVRVLGKPNKELSSAVVNAVNKMAADLDQLEENILASNEIYRIPVRFSMEE